MPLFQKGIHNSIENEFKNGNIPWNKGRKWRKYPNRWSKDFKECKICGVDNKYKRNRHYAKGLCKRCYFKKRSATIDKGKQRLRDIKRWENIKYDVWLHLDMLNSQREYRAMSKRYRKLAIKIKKRRRYLNFIIRLFETKKKPLGKYTGVWIVFEHNGISHKIPTPLGKITSTTDDLVFFRRLLKAYLDRKKLTSNEEWLKI